LDKASEHQTALPVVDVSRRFATLQPEVNEAIARVIATGSLLLGPETEAFEAEFAAFCGRRHAVAVSSGTDALRLVLAALGIGAGDEVIIPALTAVPTAAAVCAVGAVPVLVDVDPDTAGMDARAATAAATARTKAIIPVHLYGRPMNIPELDVPVLEDAAQAHGALDRAAPSIAAAYSFYPTKNLGGIGDGGAVVTDDGDIAERIRRLRTHGHRHGYQHIEISGNSRLSEIEAAVLRIELQHLAEWNSRRRAIASAYRAANPRMRWQSPHKQHVYHLCVARLSDRNEFVTRAPFDVGIHYPRALTEQAAYAPYARQRCPEAEAWAAECVSLPCFPEMTDGEIEIVCGFLSDTRIAD
jgi:dTDP-4-amino-4,6-dideoxygalactose transaminase